MEETMTDRAVFVGGPWDGARCWVSHTPDRMHVEVRALRDGDDLYIFPHAGYCRSTRGAGTEEYVAFAERTGKGPNGAPVDESLYVWVPEADAQRPARLT